MLWTFWKPVFLTPIPMLLIRVTWKIIKDTEKSVLYLFKHKTEFTSSFILGGWQSQSLGMTKLNSGFKAWTRHRPTQQYMPTWFVPLTLVSEILQFDSQLYISTSTNKRAVRRVIIVSVYTWNCLFMWLIDDDILQWLRPGLSESNLIKL